MRKQDIAIILAALALLAVAGLVIFGTPPLQGGADCVERVTVACAEPPLRDADGEDDEPARLGGGEAALAGEVERLALLVGRLEGRLAKLEKENARLAAAVDPVADLLRILEQERPRIERARKRSNEVAAVAVLRNVTSSQAQMQATARIDQDQDGTGEFGGFIELSGAAPGRMSRVLVPPVLSRIFQKLNDYGEATRNGYQFRFYLPGARGAGIGEPQSGFDSGSGVDANLAETTWCAYAWPTEAS